MGRTVFFSWQVDRPTDSGRNLVDRALEKAVGRLGVDIDIEEAVRDGLAVDRDTKGVPGQPPIVETIFKKIDAAAVFVPDLTFVGTRADGRPTPNPNVLIEYGWALRSLGHARIVPVMNSAFGEPKTADMPFDMRHLRNPIVYHCLPDADDQTRGEAKRDLAAKLEVHLKAVLKSEEFIKSLPPPPTPPPFPAATPKLGKGRFRREGEPLGYVDDQVLRMLSPESQGDGLVYSFGRGAMWLRLMPSTAVEGNWSSQELKRLLRNPGPVLLQPLGAQAYSSFNYFRAEDGYGMYTHAGEMNLATGFAFVFQTGEIWAIDTGLLAHMEEQNLIPFVEPYFPLCLESAASFLQHHGLAGPYRWIAGIEGIKGRGFRYPRASAVFQAQPFGPCVSDRIEMEGTYEQGASAKKALRPFFTQIFERCGIERPAYLNDL